MASSIREEEGSPRLISQCAQLMIAILALHICEPAGAPPCENAERPTHVFRLWMQRVLKAAGIDTRGEW